LRPVAVDEAKESKSTKLHREVNAFLRTDGGAAELFAYVLGKSVRFDHSRRRWLLWDEHYWRPDEDANVNRFALEIARLVRTAAYDDAAGLDENERKKAFGWGLDLTKRPRHEAVIAMARTLEPIADSGKNWDAAKGVLGVPNGVVNLKTGKLRDGLRDDRITKRAGVAFDPAAECPRWEKFLEEILEDGATIEYVQRLAGYSLTGEASEDKLIFLMGVGGNGKTTMMDILRLLAGDYAQEVSAMAFLEERAHGHTTEVADLEGARFATCEEIGDARLNANRMKQISGGSPITARKMKQDTRTFVPTWQLWMTTNGLPQAADNAHAFWRRVVAIDFPNVFKQSDDPDLEDKLIAELPGILAWAVRGAVEYYKQGLDDTPEAVAKHTAAYWQDTDPLQPVFEAGYLVEDEAEWTPTAILYGAYLRWVQVTNNPFKMNQNNFSKALSGRLTPGKQYHEGKEKRGYLGRQSW